MGKRGKKKRATAAGGAAAPAAAEQAVDSSNAPAGPAAAAASPAAVVPAKAAAASGKRQRKTKQFVVVKLPADSQVPASEEVIEFGPGEEIACLMDHIKEQMRKVDAATASGSEKAARGQKQVELVQAQLAEKYGADALSKIDPQMISQLASTRLVGSIPLMPPIPHQTASAREDFISVNMYYDDMASAHPEIAPFNERASVMAYVAGHEPIRVMGDVWVARIFDNEDQFERLDFQIDEMKPNQRWFEVAKKRHDALKAKRTHACGSCNTEGATLTCSRCKDQRYCGADCQKAHWKKHKKICKPAGAAAAGSK